MSSDTPPTETAAHGAAHDSVLHIAHEDHDHDPSNPHYFGLPVGVIIATVVAVFSVGLVMVKFLHLKI